MFISYIHARKKGGTGTGTGTGKTQGPKALVYFLLEQTNLKSIYERGFI